MSDVTRILSQIESGDPQAAQELLPLVYNELRKLAASKLAQEKPGQTLQATALVHEAYLRLVPQLADSGQPEAKIQELAEGVIHGAQSPPLAFNSRSHFFAMAAEAMRRILVDQARARQCVKRGGGAQRSDLDERFLIADDRVDELLEVHEALEELQRHDAQAAALVKLRFFAGFDHQEAADMLGLSRRAADRLWLLARTWLQRELNQEKQ